MHLDLLCESDGPCREALTLMQWQQQTSLRRIFRTLVGNRTITCLCWQERPMETKEGSISWSQPLSMEGSFISAKHKPETRGGSRAPTNLSRKQPLLSVLLKWKQHNRTLLCFLSSFVSSKKRVMKLSFWELSRWCYLCGFTCVPVITDSRFPCLIKKKNIFARSLLNCIVIAQIKGTDSWKCY